MNFIDELLAEAEVADAKRLIEVNKHRADQMLQAIGILEDSLAQVNDLADAEIALIEDYRQRESVKLDKKLSWLTFQLEGFMRAQDQKTINLIHGSCKLRAGRDKVEVIDIDKFRPVAEKFGLLRKVPESSTPDLKAIHAYLKTHCVPPGVILTPATVNFSYQTLKEGANHGAPNNDNLQQRNETQTGPASEPAGKNKAA